MRLEKLQEFGFNNELSHMKMVYGEDFIKSYSFVYEPSGITKKTSMSFHLTKREVLDLKASLQNVTNQRIVEQIKKEIKNE